MAKSPKVLDSNEFDELKQWFSDHEEILPESIRPLLGRLLETYSKLTTNKSQQKKLLSEMNRLLGFIPSSERGSSEKRF